MSLPFNPDSRENPLNARPGHPGSFSSTPLLPSGPSDLEQLSGACVLEGGVGLSSWWKLEGLRWFVRAQTAVTPVCFSWRSGCVSQL